MKHVLAVGLFVLFGLLLTVSVHADGLFNIKPENRLLVSNLAIAADTLTTYIGIRKGIDEANPLIGRHPSVGKQALLAALKISGNTYVETHSEGDRQLGWTWFVVGIEGSVSVNNMIVLQRHW